MVTLSLNGIGETSDWLWIVGGVGSVLLAPGGVAVLVVALEAGGVSGLGVLALAVLLKTNILVFLFRYLSMTTWLEVGLISRTMIFWTLR